MKFVMSYSCGKDSTLALHKLIKGGHEPVGLLVMVNQDMDRSWFHGADYELLDKFSDALEIPLILCPSSGEAYHLEFEKGLKRAIELGAEMAGFGDIDIENNRRWSEDRCHAAGIKAEFPLWQQGREKIVQEILSKDYCCIIKSINNRLLPKEILGKPLDAKIAERMASSGIDLCGENGEYHTIAVDGPIFKHKLDIQTGEILDFGDRSVIAIR